jgi:hypothetical protein
MGRVHPIKPRQRPVVFPLRRKRTVDLGAGPASNNVPDAATRRPAGKPDWAAPAGQRGGGRHPTGQAGLAQSQQPQKGARNKRASSPTARLAGSAAGSLPVGSASGPQGNGHGAAFTKAAVRKRRSAGGALLGGHSTAMRRRAGPAGAWCPGCSGDRPVPRPEPTGREGARAVAGPVPVNATIDD